jgi:hypothetical protein
VPVRSRPAHVIPRCSSCRLLVCQSSSIMSRYQPPHLRNGSNSPANGVSSSSAGSQVSSNLSSGMQSRWAPSTGAGPLSTRSPTVQRAGSASSQQPPSRPGNLAAQVLASPASDIRPRQATRVWSKPSDMEMLASVSRSGGDGQEGDAYVSCLAGLTGQVERPCDAICIPEVYRGEGEYS